LTVQFSTFRGPPVADPCSKPINFNKISIVEKKLSIQAQNSNDWVKTGVKQVGMLSCFIRDSVICLY